MNQIREKLLNEARKSWSGVTGENRATSLGNFLDKLLPSYSKVLGLSEEEILIAIEGARTYSAINYYQEANFPNLDGVLVLEGIEDFKRRYPTGKYRCPSCNGESTNPYECNSGITKGNKVCDWKSYGLFGTLGKGLRVVLKKDFLKHPKVEEIFEPIN